MRTMIWLDQGRRLIDKDEGKLVIINQAKVKFDDLVELLLLDHQVHGPTT